MTEQNQIRAYLLGTLEPEVADAVDTKIFLDDEFYALVREEREALADDFLAGSLSADEEARFREQCQRSPELHQAVQANRNLQVALERSRTSSKPLGAPRLQRNSLLQRTGSWRLFGLPLLAGGMCALLLTVGLVRQRPASPTHVGAPQLTPAQATQASAPPQAEVETFFLAAAVTRGATDRATIQVARETKKIRLEIEVRHDLANVPLWKTELIGSGHTAPLPGCEKASHLGDQVFLSCTLEVEGLPDGPYLLRMVPSQTALPSVDRGFLLTRKQGGSKPPAHLQDRR